MILFCHQMIHLKIVNKTKIHTLVNPKKKRKEKSVQKMENCYKWTRNHLNFQHIFLLWPIFWLIFMAYRKLIYLRTGHNFWSDLTGFWLIIFEFGYCWKSNRQPSKNLLEHRSVRVKTKFNTNRSVSVLDDFVRV